MPKLNHSPDSIDDGFPEGNYDFTITGAELRTWASGNQGMSLTVECYQEGVSFNSWENFTFTPKAMYKLREVCEATGVDFGNEDLDSDDFLNKTGKAAMCRKEGSKYLEVDYWISRSDVAKEAEGSSSTAKFAKDQVPF